MNLKSFAIGVYAGWVSMEDEQLQYLSMIMVPSADTVSMKKSPLLLTDGKSKELMDENAVVMQSKISQIKDIFPDYGNGFLAACLEAYNQNPEEVIQRILEGTLHVDLQRLDTSLETMPQPKSAPTLTIKDKGKGKLIESDTNSYTVKPSSFPSLPASSASSTTVGRFVRKPKDYTPDYKILDARKETDRERNAALLAQYEYDDEYDDSFDDLGLSVGDLGREESELFGDRAGSAGGSEPSAAPKWGNRKTPQFYVKDGKNYSYKVSGAVAVANANEASLVNEAQVDMIHGLGRGGNLPLGAVRKLTEYQAQRDEKSQPNNVSTSGGRDNGIGRGRGMGRGRGRGMPNREQHQENSNNSEVNTEAEDGGGRGRGRGRRGGGGGRNNHNHKDRAMKKHFASVSGF